MLNKFPPYLGYGKRNNDTLRKEGDFDVADYELLGQKVMKVKLGAQKVELIELLEGETVGLTVHRDLQKAVVHHFLAFRFKSPVREYLFTRLSELGNLFFRELPWGDVQFPDFPAVCHYILRLPVTDWNSTAEQEVRDNRFLTCFITRFYETHMTISWKHGNEYVKEIRILELTVPVAFLFDVVKKLFDLRVVVPEPIFRLLISPLADRDRVASETYCGGEEDSFRFYKLDYRGEGRDPVAPLSSRLPVSSA